MVLSPACSTTRRLGLRAPWQLATLVAQNIQALPPTPVGPQSFLLHPPWPPAVLPAPSLDNIHSPPPTRRAHPPSTVASDADRYPPRALANLASQHSRPPGARTRTRPDRPCSLDPAGQLSASGSGSALLCTRPPRALLSPACQAPSSK